MAVSADTMNSPTTTILLLACVLVLTSFTQSCAATACANANSQSFQATINGVRLGCAASFCNDTVFGPYAQRYCQSSCNSCQPTPPTNQPPVCKDDDVGVRKLLGLPNCNLSASLCGMSTALHAICPKTCNTCDEAAPNAGSCFFGCNGDPYMCYLLGFIYPASNFGRVQRTTCETSCVASAGRWGGMLSNWYHCLNYTRPIPDDCSLLEGGFVQWNVKRTLCTLCPNRECNDLSLAPSNSALAVLPAEPIETKNSIEDASLFDVHLAPLSDTYPTAFSGVVEARIAGQSQWRSVCADKLGCE